MFWVFFDFSTCEEEYMSDFSLLDQRQWIQSERQRMEFLGTLHLVLRARRYLVSYGVVFLSAQLVVETVEESVRRKCELGILVPYTCLHVRGGIFVSREGGLCDA